MSDLVQLSKDNDVAIITINNPPVNALAPAVQDGIGAALDQINKELAERKQLVVASKLDALDDRHKLTRIRVMCARRRLPFIAVSAVTGEGIPELIRVLAKMLDRAPAQGKT